MVISPRRGPCGADVHAGNLAINHGHDSCLVLPSQPRRDTEQRLDGKDHLVRVNLKYDNLRRVVDPYSRSLIALKDEHPATALPRDVVSPRPAEHRGKAVPDFAADAMSVATRGMADRARDVWCGGTGLLGSGRACATRRGYSFRPFGHGCSPPYCRPAVRPLSAGC